MPDTPASPPIDVPLARLRQRVLVREAARYAKEAEAAAFQRYCASRESAEPQPVFDAGWMA